GVERIGGDGREIVLDLVGTERAPEIAADGAGLVRKDECWGLAHSRRLRPGVRLQRQLDNPLLGQAEGVVVPVMALYGLGIALLRHHLLAQRLHAIEDLLDKVRTDP